MRPPLPRGSANTSLPVQYRVAYNLNSLYSKGITGAGRTIVIVDSFGSPTIANDIHVFDQQWGFLLLEGCWALTSAWQLATLARRGTQAGPATLS